MTGFVGVHVGAGFHSESLQKDYRKLCFKACTETRKALKSGKSALEAVEVATCVLENSPLSNAGFGSNLTWDGKVECDASIMDGKTLQFGAVGAVEGVSNPIKLAKILCDKQNVNSLDLGRIPPSFLVGEGAVVWARNSNIPTVAPSSLISERALKMYKRYKRKVEKFQILSGKIPSPMDTVGAVCLDSQGNLAASCSSGGIILKHTGRIGQAATYAAGCWAQNGTNNLPGVATCTTGCGEHLVRTMLAHEIAVVVQKAECAATGFHDVMNRKFLESPFLQNMEEKLGGAIIVKWDQENKNGEFLWSHSSLSMCIGYMSTQDKIPRSRISHLPLGKTQGKTVLVEGIIFR